MASSNKGIWLVLGTGAALGVAVAVYYVTVIGPRGERAVMTDQIERWARDKWQPTRACLVGDPPRAAVGYDAIVLRAAIPGNDSARAGDCTGFFADLTRPGEVSTADSRVEADWRDLSVTLGRLANRYAGYAPDRAEDREALGTALDEVDAAYAKLRADAGMKLASPTPPSQAAIRTVTPVTTDLTAITVRHVQQLAGALIVHGSDPTGDLVATVRGPTAVTIRRIHEIVATMGGEWGAWTSPPADTRHELRAGPLGPDGNPTGDGVVVRVGTGSEVTAPIFAVGADRERALLYELFRDAGPTLLVARSHDGGQSWPEQVEVGGDVPVTIAVDPTRARVDLTWTDDQGTLQWLAVDGPALAGPLLPRLLMPPAVDPNFDPDFDRDFDREVHGCLGVETGWWLASGGTPRLYHAPLAGATPATPVTDSDAVSVIADCNDSRLLGVDNGLELATLHLCTTKRCRSGFAVPIAGDAELAATLDAAGEIAAVTLTNDLLVLWRNDKDAPHPVFRLDLDGDLHLRALVAWNQLLHAVLIVDGRLILVPLPDDAGNRDR